MTPNSSVLENATPYDQDDKIIVGNGEGLPVQHIGHANLPITSSQSLLLPNDKATRAVLLKGRSSKGLYHFPKSLPFTFVSSPTPFLGQKINHIMWHQRLGHPTNEVLVKMLHSSRIVCSPDSSSMCSACIGGKMSRLPFPVSCPYTPQQNGLVERKNRHIIETVVTLMTAAALHLKFWSHACLHASFLINRMPSKTFGFCSPYQKLFQTPPELQSLRVFGSAVFPYLRPYNDNKLQPRTCQCILLGYVNGYKGVICYNRDSGRLCLSRHVVHDETVFPLKLMNSTHTSSSSRVPRSPMLLPVVLPVAPAPTTDSDNIPPQSSIPPSLHFSLQDSTSSATPPCPSTMLPVLTDAQLQVILPMRSSSHTDNGHTLLPLLLKHYSNVAHYTQSVDHSFSGVTCIAHITDTIQGTWVLVPPPPNRNILGSKWIYKVKKNPDGSVSRYKARLVAQGFS
ncbi:unnamed protein product [Prunus armeniaca]